MRQQSVLEKVDARARTVLPFGLTLVVVLFGMTPTHIPGLAQITPMYALIAVYFGRSIVQTCWAMGLASSSAFWKTC